MGLYHSHILPGLIERACSSKTIVEQREKVIPLASGKVLEIGIGSGVSLSFYDGKRVGSVTGIDPLEKLWERNNVDLGSLDFQVKYIKGSADQIPAGDCTFDTVVTTYTLCSVSQGDRVLRELHRVLKNEGKLIFSEHGKAPDKSVNRWQKFVNPVWKRVSGGCNLTRDIPGLLQQHGFRIEEMQARYINGWKLASYQYRGIATKIP